MGYPFDIMEGHIASFLGHFRFFWAGIFRENSPSGDKSVTEPEKALYFMYHYITDELLYYGLKRQVGRHVTQLADLLFSALFSHELFAVLRKEKIEKKNLAGQPFLEYSLKFVRQKNVFSLKSNMTR
jgi:hypothetical protein